METKNRKQQKTPADNLAWGEWKTLHTASGWLLRDKGEFKDGA